jgi:hypothetical protein
VTKNARRLPTLEPRRASAAGVPLLAPAATPSQKAWKNKYRAQPVVTDEGRFASKKEYADWCALKAQEKLGYIRNLERQVTFDLTINGQKICRYVADAVWFDTTTQQRIVADSKGISTPVFKLKKKLMKALLNITVHEL